MDKIPIKRLRKAPKVAFKMRTIQDKAWLSRLRKEYKGRLKNDFSYNSLSVKLGISKGCLWRFVNRGYLPQDIKKRAALGVKLITADFIPCVNCGGIHTHLCKNKIRPHALQAYDVVVEDLRNREKLSKKTLSYI